MKDRISSGKNPVSMIAFPHEFKSECDACWIQERPATCIFKQFLTNAAEPAVKVKVMLVSSTKPHHKNTLKSYFNIVPFFLYCYTTDNKIAKLDAEVRNTYQTLMIPAEYEGELWKKTISCGLFYAEKSLRVLFVEEVTHSIRKTFRP